MTNKKIAPLYNCPPSVCAVCGGTTLRALGQKDFGVSCGDHFEGRRLYPDYGIQIPYFECDDCGLIIISAFDAWMPQDFADHIYNADYALSDPPYLLERPLRNAHMIAALFHDQKESLRVLDFGGGNSAFADALVSAGMDASSFDPYGKGQAPIGTYDLITCFEVLEHVVHHKLQAQLVEIAGHLKPGQGSKIFLSTQTAPMHGDTQGNIQRDFGWWYISPRNGHVSMNTPKSLQILASRAGLQLASINTSMHVLSALAK